MGNTPVRSHTGWWDIATCLTAFLATLVVLAVTILHALPAAAASPGNIPAASTSLGPSQTESGEPHVGSTSTDSLSAQQAATWGLASQPAPAATACSPAPAGIVVSQAIAVAQPEACAAQVNSAAVASATTLIRYTVRTGDTLFGLARRFGTTVEAIIAVNNLPSCTIFICQVLLIPVQACTEECVPATVASAPVASVQTCPTLCPPVTAPTCPTTCPPVVAPSCPTVAQAALVAPVCPAALPTLLPLPVRPGASQPILVAHVVQPGEDIFSIAIRYRVNVAVLMQVNYLSAAAVKVGQTLLIP